jgi:hypothetical protein
MKILQIGLCVQPPPINGLQKAFINNSTEYKELSTSTPNLNQRIIEITTGWVPDLVFMQIQCAGIVHLSTVKHLKNLGCYIINWNGDVRDITPEWMVELAPYVNSCFTNMRDVRFMRSLGFQSDWVEIGYDPEIYTPVGKVNPNIKPIVYFGNNVHSFPMSGFRREMCAFLKSTYGDKFGVYGIGQKDGDFNHSQLAEAEAYRGAKIAINVSHYEIEKYTSDRMYRILGSGVLCLAKWYPGIDMDDFGHRFRVWSGLQDLKHYIDYYLKFEDECKMIALNGHEHALNNYTFDHMVKNLIKLAK